MDIEKFINYPITNIGRMIGDIRNLDWMDFEKLKDDVSIGTSMNGEVWFIVLKCKIQISRFKYKTINQCFQQVNKNLLSCWCSHVNTMSFINANECLILEQIELLERLILGEIVTLKKEHFPFESQYEGKRIATLNTWERKMAVKKIERNWLVCRYNPEYKMCETVLIHNILEAKREYESSTRF